MEKKRKELSPQSLLPSTCAETLLSGSSAAEMHQVWEDVCVAVGAYDDSPQPTPVTLLHSSGPSPHYLRASGGNTG